MRRFFFGLAVFALAAPVPLWAETTDRQIAQQIVKELKCQKESGQLKGFNLDLKVEDGSVFLTGYVSQREQRRKAVEAARGVAGVKQVLSEIEIKSADASAASTAPSQPPQVTRQPGNFAPAHQLEAKLASTRLETPPAPPRVSVEAAQEEQSAAAEPSASDREISGLLQAVVIDPVVNDPAVDEPIAEPVDANQSVVAEAPVNVFRTPQLVPLNRERALEAPAAAPSAREITQAIVEQYRGAMERGELKGFGIDVAVNRGIVTLRGTVANPAQLEYAIEVARGARGVTDVVDALEVARGVTPSPEAQLVSHDEPVEGVQHAFRQESAPRGKDWDAERLANEVVSGLQQKKQEGLLSNFGIDVRVDQRIVRLSGYVQDAEQHAQALDVARYVPGVLVVVDDLQEQSGNANLMPVAQETALHPLATPTPQGLPMPQTPAQPMAGYQYVPVQYLPAQAMQASNQTPVAFAPARPVNYTQDGQPVPMTGNGGVGIAPARFDHPQMPGYAWPSYAAYPNYGAVTYPKQYSPSAWPYIGPFYPYPQVPLGWRRVTLEWDDGWWNLKFKNTHMH